MSDVFDDISAATAPKGDVFDQIASQGKSLPTFKPVAPPLMPKPGEQPAPKSLADLSPEEQAQVKGLQTTPVNPNFYHPQSVAREAVGGALQNFTGTASKLEQMFANSARPQPEFYGPNETPPAPAPSQMAENTYQYGAQTNPGVVQGVSNMVGGLPNMLAGPVGVANAGINTYSNTVQANPNDPNIQIKALMAGGVDALATKLMQGGMTSKVAENVAAKLAPSLGKMPAAMVSRIATGALTMGDQQALHNMIEKPADQWLQGTGTAAATGGLMEAGGGAIHDTFGKTGSPVEPGATKAPSEVAVPVEGKPSPAAQPGPEARLPAEDQARVAELQKNLSQVNMNDVERGPKPTPPPDLSKAEFQTPKEVTQESPARPEDLREASNIFDRMRKTDVNERRQSNQPVTVEHRFEPKPEDVQFHSPQEEAAYNEAEHAGEKPVKWDQAVGDKTTPIELPPEKETPPEQAMKTAVGRAGLAQRAMNLLGLGEDAKAGKAYIQSAKAGGKAREAAIEQTLGPFRDLLKDIPFEKQLKMSDEFNKTGHFSDPKMEAELGPMLHRVNGVVQKELSKSGVNTMGMRTGYIGLEAVKPEGMDETTFQAKKKLLGKETGLMHRTTTSDAEWYKKITDLGLIPSHTNMLDMHMGKLANLLDAVEARNGIKAHLDSGYAKQIPLDTDVPAGYKPLPPKLAEDPIINQQSAEDVEAGKKKQKTQIVVPEAFADQLTNYLKAEQGKSVAEKLMNYQRKLRYLFDFFTAGRSVYGAVSEPLNTMKGRQAINKLKDMFSENPDERAYAEHITDAIRKSGVKTSALPEIPKGGAKKSVMKVAASKIGNISRALARTADRELSGPMRIGGALADIDIAEKEGQSPKQAQEFLTRQRQAREAIVGHSSDVNTLPGSVKAINHTMDMAFPTYRYHLAGALAGEKAIEGAIKGQGWRSRTASAQIALKPVLMIMATSAITQKAMTGQWPSMLQDFFQPKTGHKNPDGTDRRVSLPSPFRGTIDSALRILKTMNLGPEFDADFDPVWKAFYESAINSRAGGYGQVGNVKERLEHVAGAVATPILPTQIENALPRAAQTMIPSKHPKWEPNFLAQLGGVKGAPSADERSLKQNEAIAAEQRKRAGLDKGKK